MTGRNKHDHGEMGRRFSPRALGVRNVLLSHFARHRGLPLPGKKELAAFGDTVGLVEAARQWEQVCYTRSGRTPGPWWRDRLAEYPRVTLVIATVAAVVGILAAGWYALGWLQG